MNCEVHLVAQQRFLDLLGEQAFAADLGERAVLNRIA
jgi:hypothetical protein